MQGHDILHTYVHMYIYLHMQIQIFELMKVFIGINDKDTGLTKHKTNAY